MKTGHTSMIVVIGATSFIGIPVVEKLLDRGYELRCFIKAGEDSTGLKKAAQKRGKQISVRSGNLNSPDSIYAAVKEAQAVVYLTDLKRTDFVRNTLSAAARAKVARLVFLSSTTVLVPLESRIKKDKLASETLIAQSGTDYSILRASMIYGLENDTNFSKMIRFIQKKGYFYLFGQGQNRIQPVYIQDVAWSLAAVIDNEHTFQKTYELAGKEPITYAQMLDIVKEKMDMDFTVKKIPLGLAKIGVALYAAFSKNPRLTPDQIQRLKIDKTYSYEQAYQDFGFSPLGFEEGIYKLIKKIT